LNFEVDGNSLLDIMNCAEEAINHVRMNRKPAFIEALTYRIYSHVGFDTDLNVGLNRISDLKEWSGKDPISLLRKTISENFPNEVDWDVIENKINGFVEDSWIYGLNAEFPDSSELFENVYWSKE
jgi:TPP-dependent pyruvate/acetoin dehydrogenase alpha subunit